MLSAAPKGLSSLQTAPTLLTRHKEVGMTGMWGCIPPWTPPYPCLFPPVTHPSSQSIPFPHLIPASSEGFLFAPLKDKRTLFWNSKEMSYHEDKALALPISYCTSTNSAKIYVCVFKKLQHKAQFSLLLSESVQTCVEIGPGSSRDISRGRFHVQFNSSSLRSNQKEFIKMTKDWSDR